MDIKPNCAGMLQAHIAKAVKELLAKHSDPNRVTPTLKKNIERAELNLRIFILKMIRSAREDGEKKTREDDFARVEAVEGTIFTGKKFTGR